MRLKHKGAPKLKVIAPMKDAILSVNPNNRTGWRYRATKGWIKH